MDLLDPAAQKANLPASMTAVLHLYHHRPFQQPTSVDSTFERAFAKDGRPTATELTVGEEWRELTLAGAGFVILRNFWRRRNTIPTPEEAAADQARVLQVSFFRPAVHAIVPVGEAWFLTPACPSIWLRCAAGTADAVIDVYPE